MLLYYICIFLSILLDSTFCYPRGKVTEKPEIPPMDNPTSPRNKKPPTHISEFTDPHTGLNPYVDLEEGPTSVGRNVMEDERRDDIPYFDLDLVEGDAAPNRKWGMEEPKEAPRYPEMNFKDEIDIPVVTTPHVPLNPPTTVEILFTQKVTEISKVENDKDEEMLYKVTKQEKESFTVSRNTVIYASISIAAATAVILLIGACWWRRKLKTSRTSVSVQNEIKS